ncbi:MAG TPA: RNA methyltransferase [Mycobacteriales bacterium]|jgi:tRNA G18 (ribose-2'-O)-methylase SpoU|nr:RNA methyltransferase [Mycobacteriales bacterium]
MGPVVEIHDVTDDRLADYRDLTDVALRTKIEGPHGLFIAEGARVIERAIATGYQLRSVVMTPEWLERTEPSLAGSDAPIYLAAEPVLRELTGFHVHRGALASVHRQAPPDLATVLSGARRIALVENLVNHTNLGAVFRAATALGIQAVVLSPSSADPLYRRSVRVSMGAVFTLPYARATSWPGDIERIRETGFTVAALTPAPGAVSLDEVVVADGDRLAVMIGTEGPGLSDAAVTAADFSVRIPMSPGVDSLNVAAAASVAFWALRDRTAPTADV